MRDEKHRPVETAGLRRRAEKQLEKHAAETGFSGSGDDVRRLFHELQVHQVELEMQNAELRQSRDEQEKALNRYSELYDFAPVGYMSVDRAGIIRSANLTIASQLGIWRNRLVDHPFAEFVAVADRAVFDAFLVKTFANRTNEPCEVALLNAGKPPLFAQIEAVADTSGQECRVAIIDITARRLLEEEIVALNSALAARADMLETANVELQAFNYSVSHDLRGPLMVIAGSCDVIEELYADKLVEKGRQCIRTIHKSTMKMSRLIETLLNFSSITRQEIHPEPVDLSSMAGEVAAELQMADPERQATFQCAAGNIAKGDADLLRVVLDNLIGNAWKFTATQKQPVIEFGVTEVAGKAAYFIRDNGPGFDMALADKLFLPFQRLSEKAADGHGIGLATVERIIRRHGGRVWAESRAGEGASFFFTLV
jgi:signal transduction histidine kinase